MKKLLTYSTTISATKVISTSMAQSISKSVAEDSDSAIIIASISSQSSASKGALDIQSQSKTSTSVNQIGIARKTGFFQSNPSFI
jgi:hypothetical protein